MKGIGDRVAEDFPDALDDEAAILHREAGPRGRGGGDALGVRNRLEDYGQKSNGKPGRRRWDISAGSQRA